MEFLDFLRENSNTWTSNCVVFNGSEFRLSNDTFPRFELTEGRVREYLGDYTPYTLSSVNSWGGEGEYSVWKNGTATGYNIKINGGKVEVFSAGTRYYDDLKKEDPAETAATASGSNSYGSSDEKLPPYAKWFIGLGVGFVFMLFPMILIGWWSPVLYAMVMVTWFFSITWDYFFKSGSWKEIHEKYEDKAQSFSKSKKIFWAIAKAFIIVAPTVILNLTGVFLVIDPEGVLNMIPKGVLIALYVVFFLYNILPASYLFHSEYHGIELINEFILPLIMAAANFSMIILFGVGLGL